MSVVHRLPQRHTITNTPDAIDGWPPLLRALVQDFGFSTVVQLMDAGMAPEKMRHVIYSVWRGAREPGQRPARYAEGQAPLPTIEAALMAGSICSVPSLQRHLIAEGSIVAPLAPTRAMIDASMDAVKPGDRFYVKREKHAARLIAALRAHRDAVLRTPQAAPGRQPGITEGVE